jgi:hypothetical protein
MDDEGAIVVGKQAYFCGGFDADGKVFENVTANGV